MGTGLVAGMGYLGYAFLVAVILGGVTLLYNKVDFGAGKKAAYIRHYILQFRKIWTTQVYLTKS